MPTYQYACTACDERLEVVQKFTDDPLTVCPECEGRLRKVFSAVGVVFKGSGFYRTDSREAGRKANGSAEKKSDSSAKNDSASKSSSDSTSSSTDSSSSSSSGSSGSTEKVA